MRYWKACDVKYQLSAHLCPGGSMLWLRQRDNSVTSVCPVLCAASIYQYLTCQWLQHIFPLTHHIFSNAFSTEGFSIYFFSHRKFCRARKETNERNQLLQAFEKEFIYFNLQITIQVVFLTPRPCLTSLMHERLGTYLLWEISLLYLPSSLDVKNRILEFQCLLQFLTKIVPPYNMDALWRELHKIIPERFLDSHLSGSDKLNSNVNMLL